MSHHLSGEAGPIQAIPELESIDHPQIFDSHVFDRLRDRWTTVLATGAMALAVVAGPIANEQPAAADTPQAVAGMPFEGKWAYSTPTTAGCGPDSKETSHPSCHETYIGDWSTDLYGPAGTEVKLNVSGSSLSFSWEAASGTCGETRRIKVFSNNTYIGRIHFTHLKEAASTNTAPSNGMVLGKIANLACNPGGSGKHIHVEFDNAGPNTHSCYTNYSNSEYSAGVTVGAGSSLGVLGSANSGEKQVCAPDSTPPPPPDTDHDGIIDAEDQCAGVPGIPGLRGCPPKDIDRDGLADLVIVDTADNSTGVTEAHELAASGGYVNWLGHQITAANYLNTTQLVLMGDVNADYRPDVVVVDTAHTSSGHVEVHALDGTNGFSTWIEHAVTPLAYVDSTQKFALADINDDNRDDLLVINTQNTGSGKVEIHALDAATHYSAWLGHWVTPANYLDLDTQQLLVGDANGDKRPDVLVVDTANTSSGLTEIHELNGANGFSTWQAHWVLPVDPLDSTQSLAMGDANADKIDDLFIINTVATGSGKVEVHLLNGATHYSAWLGHHIVTPLASLDPTQKVLIGG